MREARVDVRGPVHLRRAGVDGPPVVLVHGLDGSAASWWDLVPLLADDHRCLAIDLPGFGRSPRARHRGTLEAHAMLVAEVVRREVGGPAVLVGNSAGAVVALLAAARHPQAAAAVVLVAPALPGTATGTVDRAMAPLLASTVLPGLLPMEPWRRHRQPSRQQVERLLAYCYAPDSGRASEAALAEMAAVAADRELSDHVLGWTRAARSLFWWLGMPERFHEEADRVAVAVHLIEGVQDPVVPRPSVRAALDRHPGWVHVPLAGVGHVPQLERPEAVAAAVRVVTGVG